MRQLLAVATKSKPLGSGLSPINKKSVEVYVVDSGEIAKIANNSHGEGCIFSDVKCYLIFVDIYGASEFANQDFTINDAQRYIVLEE